jgi:hypothetical protein
MTIRRGWLARHSARASSSGLGSARTSLSIRSERRRISHARLRHGGRPKDNLRGADENEPGPVLLLQRSMPLLEDRPHHGRRVESCSETRRCTNTPNAAVDQFITAHHGHVRASVCGREYRHIADARDEISAELRDLLGDVTKTRRSRAQDCARDGKRRIRFSKRPFEKT